MFIIVKITYETSSLFTIYCAMKIGYARVSSFDQNLDLQRDALKRAGCDRVIVDKTSGKNTDRPGLKTIKEILRAGDVLVVWRLDRLGRSLKDLIEWVNYLDKQEVALTSLEEAINTSSATGKLVFHIFGALAEFERQLIRERTQAGLAAARARGRRGGRPKALNAEKRALAIQLYEEKKIAIKDICELMGISKPTLYTYIKDNIRKDVDN
jgi:DNA invertase Pin-like site-specific DNA recombinase